MKKCVVELANTVHWDRAEGDKVYLDEVHVVITEYRFNTRQVYLRFTSGPGLDFSIVDMDRLAIEYFKLRGIELPVEVCRLANATPPPKCDFVVPSQLMRQLPRNVDAPVSPIPTGRGARKGRKPSTKAPSAKQKKRRCARCGQRLATSGDWFADLCPECADRTQGEWVCEQCGRHGDFETMGGSGAINPVCCGAPCKHTSDELLSAASLASSSTTAAGVAFHRRAAATGSRSYNATRPGTSACSAACATPVGASWWFGSARQRVLAWSVFKLD
jgi:hypothetical protein